MNDTPWENDDFRLLSQGLRIDQACDRFEAAWHDTGAGDRRVVHSCSLSWS